MRYVTVYAAGAPSGLLPKSSFGFATEGVLEIERLIESVVCQLTDQLVKIGDGVLMSGRDQFACRRIFLILTGIFEISITPFAGTKFDKTLPKESVIGVFNIHGGLVGSPQRTLTVIFGAPVGSKTETETYFQAIN